MKKIHLFSPAKLNLFFKIIGKRNDGYHEIVSQLQALDFGDEIEFALSDENKLHCMEEGIPLDSSNLIFKALNAFNKRYSLDLRLDVHLNKNIPMQAGLGGGSSNAATTLFALRELSGIDASNEELASIAAEFSSDAPFFFSDGSAICYGRGEKMSPAKEPLKESVTLIWPSFGVSTPECYKRTIAPRIEETQEKIPFYGDLFENDLEIAAFSIEPRLKDLKEGIQLLGFQKVLMTGSGSCFYACGNPHSPLPSDWNRVSAAPIFRKERSWYEKRSFC